MKALFYQVVAADAMTRIDPRPIAPPGVAAKTSTVLGWVFWISIMAVITGLLIGFGKLAIANQRGEAAEGMKGIGITIIAAIGISASSGIAWLLVS